MERRARKQSVVDDFRMSGRQKRKAFFVEVVVGGEMGGKAVTRTHSWLRDTDTDGGRNGSV